MDDLREAVQEDGSLQLIGSGYISWNVGNEEIVLDGRYTLEQLEFIVAHMKRPTKRAPDLLPAPACCASFVSYGVHHRDCRLAQTASG